MTWTPPNALVERVADRICEALASWLPEPLHRMAYEDAARIALAATPLGELVEALTEARDHFTSIAAKAEHWRAVVQNSEIAEPRWSGIRNHARHRASVIDAALARAKGETK
jgi:hypothetical protein